VCDDTRGYATSAAAATDVRRQQPSAQPRQIDPLDLKFNDPIAAFKSKTTMELMRAYVVYQICSIEYIVENNMKVRIPTTGKPPNDVDQTVDPIGDWSNQPLDRAARPPPADESR